MFRKELRLQIWAFILMSLGGFLLHTRIHKPAESTFFWLPTIITLANAILLPILFNKRRTVAWGYLLNLLTVAIGTIAMAWFSCTHWKGPVTPWTLILNSTLADILILGAKLPIAHQILRFYLDEERETLPAESSEPQPDIAVSVPLVGEVATARVMPSGLRWLVGACFIGVALLALGIAVCIGTHEFPARLGSTDPLIQTLLIVGGRTAATTAAVLFMLQFTLSSRLRVLDQVFGLDRLLVLHRYVGSISGTLAIAHPTLLFASTEYELGPASFEQAKLVGGMIAAGIVTVIVLTSIFRLFLGLKYESWRKIHYLSFALVLFIGVHSLALGADLAGGWTRMVWMGMLAGYALLFVWVKLARPALVRSRGYVVESVDRLSHDTHNLRLKPKGAGFGHVPGQFGFLTLRSGGVKRETHPFTVSTPPTVDGAIDFTIKASGDFTATIREAEPGDEATVEGPYGRFSHVSHGDSDLLLIAGGVGITPFLSQLRYLAATGDTRHITLIWGNKTEGDILLRDELTTLGEKLAGLTVHHVLSAQDDWSGERGYVDAPMLERLLDETARRARAFVCGPPAMMDSVVDALGSIGFASNRIHTERFAFDSELLPPEFRKSPKDD